MTPDSPDPIREAAPEDATELLRAMALVRFGIDPEEPLGFRSDPVDPVDPAASWSAWCAGPFRELEAPHLIAVHGLAARGAVRELVALDAEFGSRLPPEAARASRTMGGRILEKTAGAKARGALDRARPALWESGGFLPTVLALHAQAFQIPMLPALLALAETHWLADRIRRSPDRSPRSGTDEFARSLPPALHAARACLAESTSPIHGIA